MLERATGKVTNLTENHRSLGERLHLVARFERLFFTSEDRGRQSIQYLPVTGGGARIAVSGDSHLDDMQFTRRRQDHDLHRAERIAAGGDLRGASSRRTRRRAHASERRVLDSYQLTALEEFWVEGAEKAQVQSFIVKPPDFDAEQEISGADADSRRSARRLGRELELSLERAGVRGRGLRGGDAESARIDRLRAEVHRRDQWRLGRPRLRRHHGGDRLRWRSCPTPITNRMAAAGGSYGGYMVDWMLGHTQRFKALVSHDGVFDLRSEAARNRRAVVSALGIRRRCPGTTPRCTRAGRPAIS